MAALTVLGIKTVETRSVFGNKRIVIGTIVMGDASGTWPSGGLALAPADIGLKSIEQITFDAGEMQYFYNKSTGKVDAFVAATTPGAAVIHVAANGSTPTAATVRFLAIGY